MTKLTPTMANSNNIERTTSRITPLRGAGVRIGRNMMLHSCGVAASSAPLNLSWRTPDCELTRLLPHRMSHVLDDCDLPRLRGLGVPHADRNLQARQHQSVGHQVW